MRAPSRAIVGRARAVGDDVEPEVERAHRVRERADRDDVDAGRRDRRDRVERDAAGCLDDRAPGDERDARAQVVGA